MNIYLVIRTDDWSYDEYDSFICAAETEQAARETWPSTAYPRTWNGTDWVWLKHDVVDRSWQNPQGLEVRLLGQAVYDQPAGVICASFNAG
jgi:hypothetical protein